MNNEIVVVKTTESRALTYIPYLVNLDTGEEKQVGNKVNDNMLGATTLEAAIEIAKRHIKQCQKNNWKRPYPPTINIRNSEGKLETTIYEDEAD